MKVATGLAIGTAPVAALAAKAVESAMAKANIHAPSSVLLFLTSEFAADPQSAIKAAAKAASCTQVIGCSAAGIFTEEYWVIDSPAAAAMVFSDMNFSHPKPDEFNNALLLTLAAPNAINTIWLNPTGSNTNAPRFGGVAGDATGHGAFSVWQDGKGTTQGYCEVTLNNASGAVAATHGLKIISAPRRITKCKDHDLQTIAHCPAFSSLASACQKYAIATEDFPYHQLMAVHASKASALRRQLASDPEFALLFSCLSRGPYFYNGIDQDLALIKTLFPAFPMIGFYGNGEIAPMNGIGELLQHSAVLGLFTARNIAYS